LWLLVIATFNVVDFNQIGICEIHALWLLGCDNCCDFVVVGNIPYDATEEQLVEICQEVGPVVSFR